MKKYFLTLLLSLTLFVTQKSWACDLLAIDIGSDKSTIENIFGTIDTESTAVSYTHLTLPTTPYV